jgi:cardiolipin synthase (CMP-forming)
LYTQKKRIVRKRVSVSFIHSMMTNQNKFTLPNGLTLYRIVVFPLILYFALSGKELLYVVFFVFNLLTDIADGYIARRYKLETELGARLDSIADDLSYLLAFIGIFVFKWDAFRPHAVSFFFFAGFLVATVVVSLIRFRGFPSFHLYTTKIGGYIEGIFFICLFTVGFITPLYYVMIIWGTIGAIEHIIIQLIIPELRSNVKGLYWVLKENKSRESKQER